MVGATKGEKARRNRACFGGRQVGDEHPRLAMKLVPRDFIFDLSQVIDFGEIPVMQEMLLYT